MKLEYVHKILKKDEEFEIYNDDKETGIVILSGQYLIDFVDDEMQVTGERKSVFDSDGHVIYVPRQYTGKITAQSSYLELVIISTKAEKKLKPFIKQNGFHKEKRGNKEYKRTVVDLISEEDETDSLFIGETFHIEGVWSGYPPHKHDREIMGQESCNEEVYFIKIRPTTKFGVFISYDGKSKKEARVVDDGDFIYVKKGYHSIVSVPECDFYYLWAASSKRKKFTYSVDSDFIQSRK